ncbi:protein transport protein bet1 [Malassezia cuniculi]|uniref:Protein transport protein bet1 n=1 Tax=Malassezia cuniculi TaxID=948313 RepID=A0AAF0ENB5_9BASI|nr:protein transport protein bet1 [Malassezia cuniculi]
MNRHALLTGQSYPSALSSGVPSPQYTPYRTDSPFENPYARSYGDTIGAPKKEPFYGNDAQQRTAADLEEQNDMRLEGLSERIRMLKDVREC